MTHQLRLNGMLIKTNEELIYRSFLRNLSVFVSFLLAFLLFSSFSYAQNHSLNSMGPGVAELTIDPMHQPEVGAAADQDDNPAGNSVDGSIDVGGAAVIYLRTPAPKGTRLTGFESGDPSNPASGELFCNGVNWVGDGSTYTGTCTERVAASNSNQCGYNEPLPRPAFGLSTNSDPTCGSYSNPCVVQAGESVAEVADPRYKPLCNSSTRDEAGNPISVNCMSTQEFNEQYSGQNPDLIDQDDLKALPANTLELGYDGHDYIIFNGCDSRYYRIHLYDPVMAGMTNSTEKFVIPTRCDYINDYNQSMTVHQSGAHGLEVDQACPPGIIDFCPPSNTAELFTDPAPSTPRSLHPLDNCNILNDDGGGGCNPENPASTNMSGINMVPPDPVCDYGGNNYPLFSEYSTGTGETTQGCNCECNGSLPPWNSSAALGNCTNICGPGAFSSGFRTAGDVEAAGYCGPESQLVAGTDLTGPNGTLSWQCRYYDPDTGSPTGFTANCSTTMNDYDPGCSVQNYANQSGVIAGASTNPAATDGYLGERADCGGTADGWTQLTASSAPEPTEATITNNDAYYSTSSCDWNNDGVNMRYLNETDQRFCNIDRDPYTCVPDDCDITDTTENCSCTSGGSCDNEQLFAVTDCDSLTVNQACRNEGFSQAVCNTAQFEFRSQTCCNDGNCRDADDLDEAEIYSVCLDSSFGPSCSSSSTTNNRTVGGACPSVESSSLECSSAPGHDGNSDTYISTVNQNFISSPVSAPRVFDGTSSSPGGVCPALQSPPSCSSATSGSFIDSTRQMYQCRRDYGYYNCNCNEACGAAHGGIFNDASSVTTATQCAGTSTNSSPINVSGNTISWTCETADEVRNCSATLNTTAIDGTCGPATGGTFNMASDVSAAGACGAGGGVVGGDPAGISGSGSTFTWTCAGSGGGANSPTCSATRAACVWEFVGQFGENICGDMFAEPCPGSAVDGDPCSASDPGICSTGISRPSCNFDGTNWSGSGGTVNFDLYRCGCTTSVNATCGFADTSGNSYNNAGEVMADGACGLGDGLSGSINDSGDPITWTCAGTGGGSSASCSAPKVTVINGQCNTVAESAGPYDDFVSISSPCTSGTLANSDDSGDPITWDCLGSGPGHTDEINCSADKTNTINGTCGTAAEGNGPYLTLADITDPLCVDGTPANQNDSGDPITWDCLGSGPGHTDDNCSTPKENVSDGICNPSATGPYYSFSDIASPCSSGIVDSPITSISAATITWNCLGSGTGSSDDTGCTAPLRIDGQCSSFGGEYTSQPANSGNGCAEGTYANLSDSPTEWIWRCNGENGGAHPTCTANKDLPACGGNVGGNFTALGSGNSGNCSDGSVASFTDNGVGSTFTWTCNKSGETTGLCTANHIENGSCRSFGGQYTSQPGTNTSNACTSGTYSNVGNTPSNWRWQCVGIGPGSTPANCSAAKDLPSCGGNVGGNFTALGSGNSGNCADGSVVSFTDNGVGSTFTWRCQQSGETTGLCTANHTARNCSAATFGSGSTACSVGALSHNSSGGSCAEDGSCSYECDDGTLNEISNSCTPASCGACPGGYTQVGDDCERVESTSRGAMISCFVENTSRVNIDCGAGPCNDVCTSVDIGITGTFRTIETVRTLECQSGSYVDIGTNTRYGANQTADTSYERLEGGYASSYSIEDPDFSSFQSECDALPSSSRTCEWEWYDESPTSPSCYWVSYGFDEDYGTTCIIDIYDRIDDPTIY